MIKRLPLAVLAAAALALAAAGCGSSSSSSSSSSTSTGSSSTPQQVTQTQPSSSVGSGPGVKVTMQNIAFNPKSVTVKVGQTITWVNEDSVEHNVTTQPGSSASFKSKNFGQGGTYSWKATKPGTVKYVCTIHPGMDASITVLK